MGAILTALLCAALQQPAKAEEAGSMTASSLVPGSLVLLVRVPADCADAALYCRLWSENEEAQVQALAALSDRETVSARVEELAKSASARVQALALPKVGKVAAGDPVAARAIADIDGVARFPSLRPGRYHLFATRPLSTDLHRADLDVSAGRELAVDAKSAPPAADAPKLVRISSGGQVAAELPLRVGEAVEVPVTGPTVRVEVTDVPAAGGERLGQIQLASRVYGIYVKLDPGFAAKPGEEVVIVRDGREVARTKIVRVLSGDPRYPAGAAQTVTDPGEVRKGDEVRRVKEENK